MLHSSCPAPAGWKPFRGRSARILGVPPAPPGEGREGHAQLTTARAACNSPPPASHEVNLHSRLAQRVLGTLGTAQRAEQDLYEAATAEPGKLVHPARSFKSS